MMERLKEGIHRVCIPFDNIYTSAFILTEGNDAVILDSGNSNEDAEGYIIPIVQGLGVNVKYIIASHTHQDHYGGINALKRAFQKAEYICYLMDKDIFLGRFQVLNLKGHSDDSLGVLDIKTKTLLSCDSLQAYGVGHFKTLVDNKELYYQSIEKVRLLDIDTIIASHEYEPYGSIIKKNNINDFLQKCIDAVG